MTLKDEIEQLKKDIFSNDWNILLASAGRLAAIGGDEVLAFLLSLLQLDNSELRNGAAIALKDMQDHRAVEPLIKAILKKENHKKNGTLVYALTELDCSRYLKEIFTIIFYEGYEAKMHAFEILSSQIFTFTKEDITFINQMWEDCNLNPEKCPSYNDEEVREAMQEAVNNFKIEDTKN